MNLFGCKHDWALAEGNSPGVITGKPRELCLRRCCTKCNQREYVMNYTHIYQCDGVKYMAGPQWVRDESAWGGEIK